MTAFELFDQIWKHRKIPVFFLAIALLLCHFYLCIGQSHMASVYIKYLGDKALDGQAANGSTLDPYEIADSYVVTNALQQLGMDDLNATAIAQKIKVVPVLSIAEQEKYASWIEEFSDYENTEEEKSAPIYYRIEFESEKGVSFAREFLSALIQQYRSYYTEQYVGLNDVTPLAESVILNSEYFFSVDMLQTHVEDTMEYLAKIETNDVDYRSPVTGYSLSDLYAAYQMLFETHIAPTMQYILDTGVSRDAATLIAGLQMKSDTAQRDSEENADKADLQEQLMLLYAEKNQEYMTYVINEEGYDNQVRSDVERDKVHNREKTTYDQLMLDYVDFAVNSSNLQIDKTYIDANLSQFQKAVASADAPDAAITIIYEKYADLMNKTERTLDGYNTYKSARTMCQVSGIKIAETLPELLYYAVSAILALCLGCGLVVVQALRKQK